VLTAFEQAGLMAMRMSLRKCASDSIRPVIDMPAVVGRPNVDARTLMTQTGAFKDVFIGNEALERAEFLTITSPTTV